MAEEKELKSFKNLGVNPQLQHVCDAVGWKNPTKIQVEAIPAALKGKQDIIGLAQTGSGKTGAFAIPILQALLKYATKTSCGFFACVLCPTRELAIQVAKQFEAFGSFIGVKCAVLVEGVDGVNEFVQQSIFLDEMPHIVVATPGRLVEHLCNTNVFSLSWLKVLVLDEADSLLKDHFELVDEILNIIPPRLRIYLFSATMTEKMKKLQRDFLKDPEVIYPEAVSKYTLRQQVQEAKGISQMKNKEGGGKKRRKCDEDDDIEKKHHPGPQSRPRPLTKLGKKLKDKQEELISLAESPKKTCVEVHGKGSYSYKLVYPDGATVPVCIVGDDDCENGEDEDVYEESDGGEVGDVTWPTEESDGEDGQVPGPTEECGATTTLPGKQIPAFPLPPLVFLGSTHQ